MSLLTFAFAMATHFLVNDYGLRQDHKHRYHWFGRWPLAAAVVAGWWLGALAEVHKAAVGYVRGASWSIPPARSQR